MKSSTIVIDNGSGEIKVGYSNDIEPQVIISNYVGKPKDQNLIIGMDQKEYYVGNEAIVNQQILELTRPVIRGKIVDWKCMEQVWKYAIETGLQQDQSEDSVLISEPPLTQMKQREKMAEIFFDQFQVERFYSSPTSVLSLFSIGEASGLVIESGDSLTNSCPVYEGLSIGYATVQIEFGGRDLTDYLQKLFEVENYFDYFKNLKEKKCYVTYDYDSSIKEIQKTGRKDQYENLPDGTKIFIRDQLFKSSELLFQPIIGGFDFQGIHEAAYQSILKCQPTVRKLMYQNILLSGGNTLFRGTNNRLFKEIQALAPSTMNIKTKAPQERIMSVWIGGAIISQLESFQQLFVKAKEYKDFGSHALYKKIL